MADKRINALTNTATESDIASGNYFAIDGGNDTKKLPANLLAKNSEVADNRFDIDGIAVCNVNGLEKVTMHEGELWQTNTLNIVTNSATNRFDTIPIKAGTKYFYSRIWYNFVTIHYADGTNNYIPNATNYAGEIVTNGIVFGSFTAEQDGVIAITVESPKNYSVCCFTTSEALYLRSKGNSASVAGDSSSYYTPNRFEIDNLIDEKLEPTETELERVGTKVDKILTENVNILNTATINKGYLYPHDSTTKEANSATNCFELLQIKAGTKYYYRRMWGNFCTIKYTDGTIARLQDGQTGIISGSITPTKDGVVALTVESSRDGFSSMWTTSEEMYNKGEYTSYDVNNIQTNYRVYTCEKSGGDFQSLKTAIEEAEKYFDSVVYVGAGTWDIIDELGEEYVESVGINQRGIYLKNRIHLIFASGSKVTCNYTGTTERTRKWLSAFNSGAYGFTLENCTIESSNCRYSFHDERDSDTDAYANKFINCKMYHDNTNNPDSIGADQCIGGGLGTNGYVEIVGCYFDGLGEYSAKKASSLVSYHNTAASGALNKVVIRDCYFARETGVRLNWYGESQDISYAYVSGCSFGKAIANGAETSTAPYENFSVVEWDNTIRNA